MKKNYDLIVVGTGSGGSVAAGKCKREGWDVAVIDSLPFGGTCALRGCDPKKVLIGSTDVIDWKNRMKGKGVEGKVIINWAELMKFKKSFTDPVPASRERGFEKLGIDYFKGRAKFTDENTITVGSDELTGKYILLANGSTPAKLNIEGEELITYSNEFLELEKLPKQIIFIGGGYISFEFAHLAARAGAKVIIIHRGKRPLTGFDPDLVEAMLQGTKEIGIDVELEMEVVSIKKNDGKLVVQGKNKSAGETFNADLVVHGAGRVPNIDDMNLDKANVRFSKSGIEVNEFLQSTTNPAVYAAGDVAATNGFALTPVAGMDSHVVASNLLKGNHRKPAYNAVPTVVFTIPTIVSVGLSEAEAVSKGIKFRKNFMLTPNWYSSKRIAEKHSGHKILIEKNTDKIIGAHILGHNADELINIFALAIKHNITAAELKSTIYSYPTRSSDIGYMV